MSKFINKSTKVVVSVADEKDDRFKDGWDRVDQAKPRRGRPASSEEN